MWKAGTRDHHNINIAFKNTTFIKLRRSNTIQRKEWITLKELLLFPRLVIWVTQSYEFSSSIYLLNKRIVSFVKSNGFQWTFMYLKEALRLTIRSLSGSPEPKCSGKGIRVKRDSRGLPTIVPLHLRQRLVVQKDSLAVVRAVLTLLSVFRTFPTHVKPDLGSITSEFSGYSKTLSDKDVSRALKVLKPKIGFGTFKGFFSNAAGPNGHNATWNSGVDAFAFIHYPRQLYAFAKLGLITRSYGYVCWLIALILLLGPVYGVIRLVFGLKRPLLLGRLSVVYDQAGKARVVAMTNWWIQLALKPLHESIFRFLRRIPMDGTFDQNAPLVRLRAMSRDGHSYSCYDLSSATDRLPIDFQVQILHLCGVDGELWKTILDFGWWYRSAYYKYAVGQPMGAYSSWAMLALTHHVIVQVAAVRVGLLSFDRYAVLGDDIVIYHDAVAAEYVKIMEVLGVAINSSKSIVSKDIMEFAKRWVTPEYDVSPIGAGNILATMRRPGFITSLLREAYIKGYATDLREILSLLRTMRGHYVPHAPLALWTFFGLNGLSQSRSHIDVNTLMWCTFGTSPPDPNLLRYSLMNGFQAITWKNAREALARIEHEYQVYLSNALWISAQSSRSMRLIEAASILFSPGLALYADSFLLKIEEAKALVELSTRSRPDSWNSVLEVASLDPSMNTLSINWWERKAVADAAKSFKLLDREIYRIMEEMKPIRGADGIGYY